MKRLIVFDLDGKLVKSKLAVDSEVAKLLQEFLSILKVAMISGSDWLQFEAQVLSRLPHNGNLAKPPLLPTYRMKSFRYTGTWKVLKPELEEEPGGTVATCRSPSVLSDATMLAYQTASTSVTGRPRTGLAWHGLTFCNSRLQAQSPIHRKRKCDA